MNTLKYSIGHVRLAWRAAGFDIMSGNKVSWTARLMSGRVRRGKTHPLSKFVHIILNANFYWNIYTICVVFISFYKKMTIKPLYDVMYGSNNLINILHLSGRLAP